VPVAQSEASTIPTLRPRETASSAMPAPVTPPPTTSTSSGVTADVRASARSDAARVRGLSGAGRTVHLVRTRGVSPPTLTATRHAADSPRDAAGASHDLVVYGCEAPQRPRPDAAADRPRQHADQTGDRP